MQAMTRDERRMIDEAIQAGKVQRIPRGVTAYEDGPYCWRKKQHRRRGRKPHTNAIRVIRALAARGLTDAQIARSIGRTRKAVSNLRYRHNIPAGQPKPNVL